MILVGLCTLHIFEVLVAGSRGIDCAIRTVRVSFPVDVPHPGDLRWYVGGLATIPLKDSDTVHWQKTNATSIENLCSRSHVVDPRQRAQQPMEREHVKLPVLELFSIFQTSSSAAHLVINQDAMLFAAPWQQCLLGFEYN